jgi:hypothetical protein
VKKVGSLIISYYNLHHVTHVSNIHALFHGHTVPTEIRELPNDSKETRSRINNAEMMTGGSEGVTHSDTQ